MQLVCHFYTYAGVRYSTHSVCQLVFVILYAAQNLFVKQSTGLFFSQECFCQQHYNENFSDILFYTHGISTISNIVVIPRCRISNIKLS